MAIDGIRLDDGGSRRNWPLMVPRALLEAYQPLIGPTATVLWLNLYSLTEENGHWDAGEGSKGTSLGPEPGTPLVNELSRRMNVAPGEIQRALTVLEGAGLLRRTDKGWVLTWPAAPGTPGRPQVQAPAAPASARAAAPGAAPAPTLEEAGTGAPTAAERREANDEALSAVVAFYHQRIGLLGPSQFERLRFWVEEQGMSPDVVALAIEETVQSARTPRLNYLEGVLRNWYNDGIRTLDDLQRSQRARVMRQAAPVEGVPNAGAYRSVDADAVRQWKEMFADEYDG